MYNFIKGAALTAAIALGATAATAASYTFQYTEGMRDLVKGSIALSPEDASPAIPGFDIGTLNAGDKVAVHGRIFNNIDTFTFTATTRVKVKWILDGYILDKDDSLVDLSGYVAAKREAPGVSNFVVDDTVGAPIGITAMTFDEDSDGLGLVPAVGSPFSAEISARAGSDDKIIALAAGTYTFKLDGKSTGSTHDALYDIKISAVPLPAGALLLLTGLAGLGIARRRKA